MAKIHLGLPSGTADGPEAPRNGYLEGPFALWVGKDRARISAPAGAIV